jgi:NAD(P)-dependent dehydrogenase (short-subunit alcohol dehydrogenase family)
MSNAVITGASRGLGLEFARQYGREGWDVIGGCRPPKIPRPLADLGADIVKLDVTDARDGCLGTRAARCDRDRAAGVAVVKPLLADG